MTSDELREEIDIEIELIQDILKELSALLQDIASREPSIREKTAAAAFMAQFYGGVENILKRISKYHSVPLPSGDMWHTELFKRFCVPAYISLPALFDESLASAFAPFRRFRHVVYHSYGFQLDWERMKEGLESIDNAWKNFKSNLSEHLKSLPSDSKGFSLVELAMVLVIVGILIGVGAPLLRTLVTNIKFSQSRDIVQAAVDSVESWTAGNNLIPSTANFSSVVKNPNDAFGQALVYVYDYNAANSTNICGISSTAIQLKPNATASAIQNVAFVVLSQADNHKVDSTAVSTGTANCTNSTVPSTGCTTGTSTTSPGVVTVTITADTANDIVQWVTIDELRTKAGCQGAELRITNNELPYGYNNTSYTATIYANGGVPYTAQDNGLTIKGPGQYEWCIEYTNVVSGTVTAPANMTFSSSNTPANNIPFFISGACKNNKTQWIQADSIVLSGSPLIIVAYNSNPGTNNTYAFISTQGNYNNSPLSTASCSSNTWWSCANAITINQWSAGSAPYNQGLLVYWTGSCNGTICTFLNTQASNSNQPPTTCTNATCYNGTCNANGWQCYPMWSSTIYYPSGSNTLTIFVTDNGGNSAKKNFTFTVNPM